MFAFGRGFRLTFQRPFNTRLDSAVARVLESLLDAAYRHSADAKGDCSSRDEKDQLFLSIGAA